MIELKVGEYQLPAEISFNYSELKEELTRRCADYKTVVYTADTIKDAKADRAKLNGLKKQLNDFRLHRQREYMAPFDAFKAKIDDLIGIIDQASVNIDTQVKEYEDAEREEKTAKIQGIFNAAGFPDTISLTDIWDKRWLNKTVKFPDIQKAIQDRKTQIDTDVNSISRMFTQPVRAAVLARYYQILDINDAIRYGDAVVHQRELEEQKKKEQAAQPQPEPTPEPERTPTPMPQVVGDKKAEGQRVVVEIIAQEWQYDVVNSLFHGLKKAGAYFRVIEKEDI